MKSKQRTRAFQGLQQSPGSLVMLGQDFQMNLGRAHFYPQNSHEIQQYVRPVSVLIAVLAAHAHFVGVEKAVGQPRILAHADGDAGQKSHPGHLSIAPKNQAGVVLVFSETPGPAKQVGETLGTFLGPLEALLN